MAKEPTLETKAEATELSLGEWLWRTLQSVRMTIYVLPAIAVASMIGAVIPQQRPLEYYTMLYGARRGWVIAHLGLHHVYTSSWFIILIALLLANLAACAVRSWRRSALEYRGPSGEALARKLTGPRMASCWFARTTRPELQGRLVHAFGRPPGAVRVEGGTPDPVRIVGRRWSLAAYGRIVTHLAIFLVALGAVLGIMPWTSLDEEVTVSEGETWKDSGKLGFDVRLDKFRMDYYPGTGMPSLYASDVTLLANGTPLKKGTATVNKSLAAKRVSLGQSSWGLSGLRIKVTDPGGREEPVTFSLVSSADAQGNRAWELSDTPAGHVAFLSDRKWALVAQSFTPDAVEQGGKIVGSASEFPRHPAVLLQGVSGLEVGKHQFHDLGWLRKGDRLSFEGHTVRFEDVIYVSTLSARKDMGLPLVWAGFLLTTLGMIVMFYLRPRTLLVQLTPAAKGGGTEIAVAPSGRELFESDRHLIEQACEVELKQGTRPQ
jgi:cytochrome c biogenesis protein